MITLRQAAKQSGFTISHLSEMCRQGRIDGAKREPFSGMWIVPNDFTITPVKLGRPAKIIATYSPA